MNRYVTITASLVSAAIVACVALLMMLVWRRVDGADKLAVGFVAAVVTTLGIIGTHMKGNLSLSDIVAKWGESQRPPAPDTQLDLAIPRPAPTGEEPASRGSKR